MTRHFGLVPAFFAAVAPACANPSPPPASTKSSSDHAAAHPETTNANGDLPARSAASPRDASEPAAPTDAAVNSTETARAHPNASRANPVELCHRTCERMAKSCSESAADNCRIHCAQYEHPPAGCDSQVQAALECSAQAKDLTCVNIAPETCAAAFRRVVACASGQPEDAASENPTEVPAGWQRFQPRSGAFSVLMPRGVTEQAGPPPTFSATFGDAQYRVRVEEAPSAKPTQKNLIPVARSQVGDCGQGLRLFSMVEKPGRVSIRYESRCPNGHELQGLLLIFAGTLHVLEVQGPKAAQALKDTFFYGFEHRGAR